MRIYITFIVLLFLPCLSNGQSAPGYFGKRWSVSYDATSFLRWAGTAFDSDFREKTLLDRLHFRHDLTVDYATKRNQSIGVSLAYLRAGFGGIDNVYSKNILSRELGIHIRNFNVFRRGSIAPMGKYIESKIFVAWVESSLDENPDYFPNPQRRDITTSYHPGMSFTFGRQIPLNDLLLIDFGVEMGFVISAKNSEKDGDAWEKIFDSTADSAFSTLLAQHLLGFKIGITWAAF